MTLTIDGTPVTATPTTGAASANLPALTTSNSNDLIYVAIAINPNSTTPITVSSVTDNLGTHLSWTKRKNVDPGSNPDATLEVWYARWSSSGSITITVNFSASTWTAVCMGAFAISGADTSTIFDGHSGIPAAANANSSAITVSETTSNANDFIVGFLSQRGRGGMSTANSGFSYVSGISNLIADGGTVAKSVSMGIVYQIVSSAGTYTPGATGGNTLTWCDIGDAVMQASGATAVSGTFAAAFSGAVKISQATKGTIGIQESGAAKLSQSVKGAFTAQEAGTPKLSQSAKGTFGLVDSPAEKLSQKASGTFHVSEQGSFAALSGSLHVAWNGTVKIAQKVAGVFGVRFQGASRISQNASGNASISLQGSVRISQRVKGTFQSAYSAVATIVNAKPFKIGSLVNRQLRAVLSNRNFAMNLSREDSSSRLSSRGFALNLTSKAFSMLLSNYPLNQGQQELYQGDSVRLEALSVVDISGASVTSPSSIQITVKKPDNSTFVVTTGSIVNDGSGNYHYDLVDSTKTNLVGTYFVAWQFVNGSYQGTSESSFIIDST